MYYCFGDSITEGIPGVSYVKYLGKKFLNYGKGGDTTLGLYNRLKNFLNSQTVENIIIEIGTNDILLPFLYNYSPEWQKTVKKIIASGRIPSKNIEEFEKNYKKLLELLVDKNVLVITIPCVGEDLNNELNKKVDEYNKIIHKLCKDYSFKLVDFNFWQKTQLKTNSKKYFISKKPFKMVIDSIFVRTPTISNIVSKKRNLVTTIDGVHLNDHAARKLAELIKEKISSK